MSIAVSLAVHPDPGPDGVTHPTLILWSDGRISAYNGAAVPPKSGDDNDAAPGWNFPRYYALGSGANSGPTPTAGVANGEIGRKIVVTSWTSLADIKGHVLDGWGRVTPFGTGTLKLTATGYWGPPLLPPGGVGQDVARSMLINPADAQSGYVMDYSGGLHRFGNQATTPTGAPIPYPGFNYARDFVCDFAAAGGAHGFILGASGEITRFSHINDAWLFGTTWGSYYYGGYDIMRSLVFNFTTNLGYAMDGFGTPWAFSHNIATVGDPGHGEQLEGAPYSTADIFQQLSWPKLTTQFFVSLSDNGTPIAWQQFTKPTVTYITPATTLTNTSRPSVSFTYGPNAGTPPVAALSAVTAYMYPLSVTQAGDFRPRQGTGAIWSWKRSGIVGIEGGDVYTIPPASEFVIDDKVVSELPNGYIAVLYVQVVSAEGVKNNWTSRQFTTAYTGNNSGNLTVLAQPDDPLGRRVQLTATALTAGQVYDYQFSDFDPVLVPTTEWQPVIGTLTTTSPIYDYEALPLKPRWYRAYRVTLSPFMRSNSSVVRTVTMAMPAVGTTWRIVKLDGTGALDLAAANWAGGGRQPLTVHDPAGDALASVTSAGDRGIQANLETFTFTKAEYDALKAILKNPRVYLLQAPYDQWYAWFGEYTFEMQHAAAPAAPHPDSVYSAGVVHKWSIPVTETTRGGVV